MASKIEVEVEPKKQSKVIISQLRSFGNSIEGYSPYISKQLLREQFTPKHKLSDPNTYVGIEVEVEGVLTNSRVGAIRTPDKNIVAYLWANVEDGSLRNNGREFVSVPVKGQEIEYALTSLEAFLTKNKDCVGHEFSDRTSVHVHINARDLTMEQLASWILLYTAVEPVLYNFCGGNRHKNIFCVPLNQAHSLEGTVNYFVEHCKVESKHVLDVLGAWKKYCGFNLKPISKYGTLEFRHMVGTMDVPRLMAWIDILLMLRTYAINMPLEKLKEELPNLNTTSEYSLLLRSIFGEYAEYLQFSTMQSRMEESVIFLKNCLSKDSGEAVSSFLSKQASEGVSSKFTDTAMKLKLMFNIKDLKVKKSKSLGDDLVRTLQEAERMQHLATEMRRTAARGFGAGQVVWETNQWAAGPPEVQIQPAVVDENF